MELANPRYFYFEVIHAKTFDVRTAILFEILSVEKNQNARKQDD